MNDSEFPYWLKVLRRFDCHGYYTNGLTIPFLIGARTIIEPEQKLNTVAELLEDIKSIPIQVTVMRCGDLREYVIGLLDFDTAKSMAQYTQWYKRVGYFIITDTSFEGVCDLNTIINELSDKYQLIVDAKCYSKNNGGWNDFTDTEKARLLEIIETTT